MKSKPYLIIIFLGTLAGLIFSGYLSGVKLFTDTCAFNETCPYFLGYPACWYGFVMYLVMFATTAFALWNKVSYQTAIRANTLVSFIGIVFAGRFAVIEFMDGKITGVLGLSTCVYGLIFYILILGFCLLTKKQH